MVPHIDHIAWTRSIIVAVAIVLAALIPVIAGNDDEPHAVTKPVHKSIKDTNTALIGNRKVCLSLRGLPVSVLEKRYTAVDEDHNQSGDTAIPMNGGDCWIKWFYRDDTENGYAQKVRFYD